MNGCAPGLVLRVRLNSTWKWSIPASLGTCLFSSNRKEEKNQRIILCIILVSLSWTLSFHVTQYYTCYMRQCQNGLAASTFAIFRRLNATVFTLEFTSPVVFAAAIKDYQRQTLQPYCYCYHFCYHYHYCYCYLYYYCYRFCQWSLSYPQVYLFYCLRVPNY